MPRSVRVISALALGLSAVRVFAASPPNALERRAIAALLDRVAVAVSAGDPDALADILSPRLGENQRRLLRRHAAAEFSAHAYERFTFDPPSFQGARRDAEGRVRFYAVARYRYRTDDDGIVDAAQAYPFTVAKGEGRWRIEQSDLFDQWTGLTAGGVYRRFFLIVFAAPALLLFWGWMVVDCSIRYGRMRSALWILLTPPLGAMVYFVAGFLRGPPLRSAPRRAAPSV